MPNIFDYNPTNITPYPYWRWNKVLPAVYDDSLSQYEILSKLLYTVNEIISSQNDMGTQVEQLTQLVQQLIDGQFPSGIVQYVTDIVNAVIDDDIASINAAINQLREDIATVNDNSQGRDIVLIGDSYAQGYTPDGNVTGWVERVENAFAGTNVNVYHKYAGGSGFGIGTKTFTMLLDELAQDMTATQREKVSIIIVGGGYNDRNATASSIGSGMTSFHNIVKQYFKNANRVIAAFIGNTVTGLATGAHSGATSISVKNALTNWIAIGEAHTDCIAIYNGIGLLSNNAYCSSDYVHPSNRGQEIIYNCIISLIAGVPNENYYRPTVTIQFAAGSGYTVSNPPSFQFDQLTDNVFGPPIYTTNTTAIKFSPHQQVTLSPKVYVFDLEPNAQLSMRNFKMMRNVVLKFSNPTAYHMCNAEMTFTNDANGFHMRLILLDVNDSFSNFRSGELEQIDIHF